MATIGQTLSAARIAAGYTVADLSTRTHIRERVLRGIEEEDFVPCGGDFYARGHIRGLCRALDVNPEPLLVEYDSEYAVTGTPCFVSPSRHVAAEPAAARAAAARRRGQAPPDEVDDDEPMAGPPPQRFGHDSEPGADSERWGHFERRQRMRKRLRRNRPRRVPAPRRSPEGHEHAFASGTVTTPRPPLTRPRRSEAVRRHWPWALVAVVVLLGAFVGVRAWQGEPTNPLRTAFEFIRDGDHSADSSIGEDDKLTVETLNEGGEGPGESVAEEPSEVLVGLTASERSWVQVKDTEGEDLFVGFLAEGEEQAYTTDDEVRLWLGDAGTITVSVNGEDLGKAGEIGEVKELSVGPDGFGE